MTDKIKILNNIIKTHNQFKCSQLWTDISVVCECVIDEAAEFAKTHCNMISFYALLVAEKKYYGMYRDFFRFCLDNKFLGTKNSHPYKGFINLDKGIITDKLGISGMSYVKYRDFEDILNPKARLKNGQLYQMKIKANTSGFHFMACYVLDGVVYISDTSYRGIGVSAIDHITDKNFEWIMEI